MDFTYSFEAFCGFIASVTTVIGIVPQVWKAYKTKSMSDVSMIMLVNCLVCAVAWMIYGFLTSVAFVFWSNAFGTIVASVSIMQKVSYK